MLAAVGARTLIARLLEEPVVPGRQGEAQATADTHVALGVLLLTFGYGKVDDRFAMTQIAGTTGYGPRKVAAALQRLNTAGVLSYQPADRSRGRPLGWVSLPTTASREPGRGQGEPMEAVGRAVRHAIEVTLTARHTLALGRVILAVLAQLPTWLALEGSISCAELADVTGLNPETVGRKLKHLTELGALAYVPGRGRGRRSHVRLLGPTPQQVITRQQVTTPPAAVPLTDSERAQVNVFFRGVFHDLERQEPEQSVKVSAAIVGMKQRARLGRMVLQLLEAGQDRALRVALTTSLRPGAPAYRNCDDDRLPGTIFNRVRRCHDTLVPARAARGRVSDADRPAPSGDLAAILRPALSGSAWAGMV